MIEKSLQKALDVVESHIKDIKFDALALNVLDPKHNAYWLLKELAKIPDFDVKAIVEHPCECPQKCSLT